jgi:hypothetical protein
MFWNCRPMKFSPNYALPQLPNKTEAPLMEIYEPTPQLPSRLDNLTGGSNRALYRVENGNNEIWVL